MQVLLTLLLRQQPGLDTTSMSGSTLIYSTKHCGLTMRQVHLDDASHPATDYFSYDTLTQGPIIGLNFKF